MDWQFWLLWTFVWLIASMFIGCFIGAVIKAGMREDDTRGEDSGATEGDQRSFKGAAE